jgi:hypothetical protein
MTENVKPESFQVDELDDAGLEGVSGGTGINVSCPTTTNSGCNVVAGCGTTTPTIQKPGST